MYKCVTSRVVIKYYDLYRFYFMCVTEEEGGGAGRVGGAQGRVDEWDL